MLAGHMAAPPPRTPSPTHTHRIQNMDHYIGAEVLHPVMVVHCARCYIFSQQRNPLEKERFSIEDNLEKKVLEAHHLLSTRTEVVFAAACSL